MVKVGLGYLWQRWDKTFIGEFYLDRGEEAFELCMYFTPTTRHQSGDIILTRMLEW